LPIDGLKEYIKKKCIDLSIQIPADFENKEIKLSHVYSPKKIDTIKRYGETKGWKCLSDTYYGPNHKLEWECSKCGHRWLSTYKNIRQRKYCSSCHVITVAPRGPKYTIEDMQKLAINKNGKCLSDQYIHTQKHLLWECQKGHQ
jgi:hypothetical protein